MTLRRAAAAPARILRSAGIGALAAAGLPVRLGAMAAADPLARLSRDAVDNAGAELAGAEEASRALDETLVALEVGRTFAHHAAG